MTGNLLENVDVLVSDETDERHPVVIEHNVLDNSDVIFIEESASSK